MKSITIFIHGLLLVLYAANISANTEKLIFQANQDVPACTFEARLALQNYIQPDASLTPPFSSLHDTIKSTNHLNYSAVPSHRLYQLTGLNRGSKYELRLSYPAITPTDFELVLMSGCDEYLRESLPTDPTLSYWVLVKGTHTGVSSRYTTTIQPVIYNLVLETLYGGFLFYNVYKIVILIAGLLAMGSLVLVPMVERIVKA